MINPLVTINSRKYDGNIDKSWQAELLQEDDELFTFKGIFQNEIAHDHLGTIRTGTISYEYYWKNSWFNIFRFNEPEGHLRNFYCNVSMPPTFKYRVLDYVDLDIDILVTNDFNCQILDLDEFSENSVIYQYSSDMKENIESSIEQLLKRINLRMFPFNIDEM